MSHRDRTLPPAQDTLARSRAGSRTIHVDDGSSRRRWERTAGFTLAEVLAALVFMAILIPVALEGLSIASRAGEVAVRKTEAALLAERILNESVVTTNWNNSVQNGTLRQGIREFRYTMHNDPWVQDANQSSIRQLSVEVLFSAQGRDYSVKLSTLVDSTSAFSQAQQQQTGTGQ